MSAQDNTENIALVVYIDYKRNTVKYRLEHTPAAKSYKTSDFEKIMTKKDFAKFERAVSNFNISSIGGGNFILNRLEKNYEEILETVKTLRQS